MFPRGKTGWKIVKEALRRLIWREPMV